MSRSTMRYLILALGLATAAIHVIAGLGPLRPPLIINGAGYLAFLAAFLLDLPLLAGREKLVRYAFIGYVLLTIIVWIPTGDRTWLGFADKGIEIVLAALLVLSERLTSRTDARRRAAMG